MYMKHLLIFLSIMLILYLVYRNSNTIEGKKGKKGKKNKKSKKNNCSRKSIRKKCKKKRGKKKKNCMRIEKKKCIVKSISRTKNPNPPPGNSNNGDTNNGDTNNGDTNNGNTNTDILNIGNLIFDIKNSPMIRDAIFDSKDASSTFNKLPFTLYTDVKEITHDPNNPDPDLDDFDLSEMPDQGNAVMINQVTKNRDITELKGKIIYRIYTQNIDINIIDANGNEYGKGAPSENVLRNEFRHCHWHNFCDITDADTSNVVFKNDLSSSHKLWARAYGFSQWWRRAFAADISSKIESSDITDDTNFVKFLAEDPHTTEPDDVNSAINISWKEDDKGSKTNNRGKFIIKDWHIGETFIFGSKDTQIHVKNQSKNYNPLKHLFKLHVEETKKEAKNWKECKDNCPKQKSGKPYEMFFSPFFVEQKQKTDIINTISPRQDGSDEGIKKTHVKTIKRMAMNYFLPIPDKGVKDNEINNNSKYLYKLELPADELETPNTAYTNEKNLVLSLSGNKKDTPWYDQIGSWQVLNFSIVEREKYKTTKECTNTWNRCIKEGDDKVYTHQGGNYCSAKNNPRSWRLFKKRDKAPLNFNLNYTKRQGNHFYFTIDDNG